MIRSCQCLIKIVCRGRTKKEGADMEFRERIIPNSDSLKIKKPNCTLRSFLRQLGCLQMKRYFYY